MSKLGTDRALKVSPGFQRPTPISGPVRLEASDFLKARKVLDGELERKRHA